MEEENRIPLADNFIAGYNYFALAVPSFIAGIVGIYLFSFQLGWFPFSGSVEVGLKEGHGNLFKVEFITLYYPR